MPLQDHFKIRYSTLRKLLTINVGSLVRWDKEKVSLALFYSAILLAFFWSANVSLLWPLTSVGTILASALLVVSMLISNSMKTSIFTRKDFLQPTILCLLVILQRNITMSKNIVGSIVSLFTLFVFIAILRLDPKYYSKLATLLCKFLGGFLAVSFAAFVLYLLGISLPGRSVDWNGQYFYTNYLLFLVDDRSLFEIVPRFHSIFLEPGHMGTIIVLLLGTQIGHWDTWYNRMMMVAMFVSFSLAAYGLFVILLFLRMWMLRKKMLKSVILTLLGIAAVVGGSFIYKQGDNMLNQLIVLRLEVNETGDDIVGNNRVSQQFQSEFDKFVKSPDLFLGRGIWVDEEGSGNAGYKLYLYENGLLGFILVYLFYYFSMRKAKDKRAFWAMMILSLANFWIRSYPLWFAFYIPYFLMAHQNIDYKKTT